MLSVGSSEGLGNPYKGASCVLKRIKIFKLRVLGIGQLLVVNLFFFFPEVI